MSFNFSHYSFIYKISFISNQCEFDWLYTIFWDHGQPVDGKILETNIRSHVIYGHYTRNPTEILFCYWSVFVLAGCVPYLYFDLLSIHHDVLDTMVDSCCANNVFWELSICEAAYYTWFPYSCISHNQYFYNVIRHCFLLSNNIWVLLIDLWRGSKD